jgi:hypothetical protein
MAIDDYVYRYLNSKTHGTLLTQIIRSIILGNNNSIQGNILSSKYNVI